MNIIVIGGANLDIKSVILGKTVPATSNPGASTLSLGGVGLQPCAETDDGQRCAVEYTCVRWGGRDLPPQAGLGVYERGADGLLAAVRLYDDIEPLVA